MIRIVIILMISKALYNHPPTDDRDFDQRLDTPNTLMGPGGAARVCGVKELACPAAAKPHSEKQRGIRKLSNRRGQWRNLAPKMQPEKPFRGRGNERRK
jgi:hypothetical protein